MHTAGWNVAIEYIAAVIWPGFIPRNIDWSKVLDPAHPRLSLPSRYAQRHTINVMAKASVIMGSVTCDGFRMQVRAGFRAALRRSR